MNKVNLLLIFLLLSYVIQADHRTSQLQTKQIPGTSCTFYYSESPNTQFHFHYCQIDQVNHQDWNTCIDSCCQDLSPSTSPSSATIRTCANNVQDEGSRKIIIASIAMGAIILVCTLCCICGVACKVYKTHSRVHQFSHLPRVEWVEETQINDNTVEIKWSSLAQKGENLNNTDVSCCICLEGNPNVEIYCHHLYHLKCIGSWLKKNQCCPLCRHDHIQGIKVYCKGCWWKYLVCTTALLISREVKNIPQLCRDCQNKKERKESQELIVQESKVIIDFDKSHTLIQESQI